MENECVHRFGVDPDEALSANQRGRAVAIQMPVKENLYWVMLFDQWVRNENWPVLKRSVLGQIPSVVRRVIAPIARQGVKRQLQGHGIGPHSLEEIEAIAPRIWRRSPACLASGTGSSATLPTWWVQPCSAFWRISGMSPLQVQ